MVEQGAVGRSTRNSLRGATVHGSSFQMGDVERFVANIGLESFERPPMPRPRQLPRRSRTFVNHDAELDLLGARASAARASHEGDIVLLWGFSGSGKTELVLQWADSLPDQAFPQGQLHVDLEQLRQDGAVDVRAVLRGFLRDLDVHPELLPDDRKGLADLYRSTTAAGEGLLVVADNAQHAAEVRGLVPSKGLLVVTSRTRLSALVVRDEAHEIPVGPLDPESVGRLVAGRLPALSGVLSEETSAKLTEVCEGMPFAALALAEWLVERAHLDLDDALGALGHEHLLSSEPSAGSPSMSAVLDGLYARLPACAQRVYALLGTAGLHTVTTPLARAVVGDEADDAVGALRAARLVTDTAQPRRFRPHGLVRAHARHLAARLPEDERRELAALALAFYVTAAAHADRLVLGTTRFRLQDAPDPLPSGLFGTGAEALDWLDAESANLLPVVRAAMADRRYGGVWRLNESLWAWFHSRRPYGVWRPLQEHGLEAAQWEARADAEVRMRNQLARHDYYRGLLDAAEEELARAAVPAAALSRPVLSGMVHETRGLVALEAGRPGDAVALFREALRANERMPGETHGVLVQTYNLAQAHVAAEEYEAALALLDGVGEPDGEARFLARVALVRAKALRGTGALREAIACAATAAERAAGFGWYAKLDEALTLLGDLASDTGTAGDTEDTENARLRRACEEKVRELRRIVGDDRSAG